MGVRRPILALAAAALVAGCGSSEPRPPSLALHACEVGGVGAACGTLVVPEDPARPDGARIPISVAVVRAWGGRATKDPLLYVAGWGSAGVQDDLAAAVPSLRAVNEHRDLVFVDQRGTGRSNRLACAVPSEAAVARDGLEAVTAAARRCARRIGPRLRLYTTAVAVEDLDAVRAALGHDRIDVYGISYGGTLAQAYLRRHGDHVGVVVLDGASLLDVRIFERGGANAQRALDLLFDRCAADAACHRAYPDPRGDLRRLTAHVRRAPLRLSGGRTLDEAALAGVVDDLFAYTPGKPVVPRLLHLAAAGRLAEAASLLPAGDAGPEVEQLAYQMVIQCSEPWASWRPAEVRRSSAGTFLEPLELRTAATVAAACRGLPRGVVPADLGRRVRSDAPVLVLTGDEDPADPPANVAGVRGELPNARLVVFPAAGHGQLRLPCAQGLIGTVLDRGSTRGLDASCARTAAVLPFDTGGAR